MSVNYKLIKTSGKLPNDPGFRAVTVGNQTVSLERIAQDIEDGTAFTRGDIIGIIVSLQERIAWELKQGNNVHIDGVGYFSISVEGDLYEDPRNHQHRLRNAKVRTVRFQPDREMMHRLGDTRFENITYRHSAAPVPSEQEIDAALDELFAEKSVITANDFRRHLWIAHTTAYRILNRLEAEGRLRDVSTLRSKLYMRGEDHRG